MNICNPQCFFQLGLLTVEEMLLRRQRWQTMEGLGTIITRINKVALPLQKQKRCAAMVLAKSSLMSMSNNLSNR